MIVCVAAVAGASAETVIGPGVAGQIHALAYHPNNPDSVFAGGDNCGVYVSDDHGESWVRWNEGLADDDPRMTSYVDDLLVVPWMEGIDPAAVGVYAATRGGIAFRADGSAQWEIQTEDETYDFGYAEGVGAAIPFCSLAFDPVRMKIYAGAGDGRITHENDAVEYPEVVDGFGIPIANQWSLWSKSVASGSVTDWSNEIRFGNKSTALQIDFVINSGGNTSRGVVATKEGVFLENATGGNWTDILNAAIVTNGFGTDYSHIAAGVGVGKDGVIWALTRRDGYNDPGVFRLVPDAGVYDPDDWEEPGASDASKVPPQNGLNWYNIVHAYDDNDFKTITVNPGSETAEDEVFVGMEPADVWIPGDPTHTYNGYFRYGKCGDGVTRWVNILYRNGRLNWDDPEVDLAYASYTGATVDSTIVYDVGWAVGHSTGSTVPLQVSPAEDPNDGDEYADWMFASMFHVPMVKEFDTGIVGWEQRYATGSGGMDGYYSTRGLNIMSAYNIGFTETSKRLVVGCGDFVGVITDDYDLTGSGGFRDMDPYWTTGDDSRDLEIAGDEIYMVRQGPTSWAAGTTGWFGYDDLDGVSRQTWVISQYDETLNGMDPLLPAGYRWRYISQGLDAFFTNQYEVINVESVHEDTLFAVAYGDTVSMVCKGIYDSGDDDWDWSIWWSSTESPGWGGKVQELLHLPDTDRLLMIATGDKSLQELSVSTASYGGGPDAVLGLDRGWTEVQARPRFRRSLKYPTDIVCDEHGEWLYIATSGQVSAGKYADGSTIPYDGRCANVLRVGIPDDGTAAAAGDWECILNEESGGVLTQGIVYQTANLDFWPDNIPSSALYVAENLPLIKTVVVHPDNPHRVFIGVRAGGFKAPENFHPNNGVWEYVPDGDGGQWVQRKGDGVGEPCKGIRALGLVPGDPSTLVAGSFGQELFLVDVPDVSSPPVSGVTALEALHDEQPLLMVTLDGAVGEIGEVRVDASTWGLSGPLPLNDKGLDGDWVPDDGIWSATVSDTLTLVVGAQQLPVYVRDMDWNSYWGEVEVEVLDSVPPVYYRNGSGESNLSYTGTPTAAISFDMPDDDGLTDGARDLFMSQVDDVGRLFMYDYLSGDYGDVPQYEYQASAFSPSDRPQSDQGASMIADFNNDGLEDLIVTAGHAGVFRLYLQGDDPLGHFSLVTLPTALQTQLNTDTWSVASADYDLDGQVDIYVCRADAASGELPGPGSTAVSDILLRNDLINSGTFIDMSDSVLVDSGNLVTTGAAWCDFDGDGDPDLAVADGSSSTGLRIHVNDGVQLIETALFTPATNNVSDVSWTDIDGDGDIDLLASVFSATEPTYAFINDGAGAFTRSSSLLQLASESSRAGLRTLDHDLDSYLDVLLLPASSSGTPGLLVNAGVGGGFDEETFDVGFGSLIGESPTAVVTDLNGDGGSDLLFGRDVASGKFLCTARGSEVINPATDSWLGLRLFTADGTGQAAAIGTRVMIHHPSGRDQALLVSGGGNGRADQTILSGIEDGAGSLSCTVYWPSGETQTLTSLTANQINTVNRPATVDLDTLSVEGTLELKPGDIIDYVFQWTTTYQTDPYKDKVIFELLQNCPIPELPGDSTLTHGVSDVTIRQWREYDQGSPIFVHELRWANQPCRPCTYPFRVQSGVGTATSPDFEAIQLRNRLCTSEDPEDPNNPPPPGGN